MKEKINSPTQEYKDHDMEGTGPCTAKKPRIQYSVQMQNKYGILRDYEDNTPRDKNTVNKISTEASKPEIPPIVIKKAMEHSSLCKTIHRVIKSNNFHVKHTS